MANSSAFGSRYDVNSDRTVLFYPRQELTVERPTAIADELLARLPATPDAYPQKFDLVRESVLVIRFDAAGYRAASFLDDRILSPATQGAWLPMGRVADASRRVPSRHPVHFIFHTGHVGSTLVSRLLDETGRVLSLREPLPLRTLAEAHDLVGQPDALLSDIDFDVTLSTFVNLWSRGYDTTRAVVVKATSSTGRIAAAILHSNVASRALYLNLRAEPYLATLLAGRNSPVDLRGHGQERIRRLCSRLATPPAALHTMSIGELAAMSWLAETFAQMDATERFAGIVMPLDFEAFLADVGASMAMILGHFGIEVDQRYLPQVGRSPVLMRYSKAPEFAFTPEVRAEVLRDSRRDNREEIRMGMRWLERTAESETAVGAILNRSSS
ncbi:MAG: hypothetical protein ABI569_10880 [Casimicrobiaceae bacterium]